MRITEVIPRDDDYVDFFKYYDDDQLERREIDDGHLYIARIIINQLQRPVFAADYFVSITDIIFYENHMFEEYLEEKIATVVFEPRNADGEKILAANARPTYVDGVKLPSPGIYAPYIEDDGTIYACNFDVDKGQFVYEGQGYFVAQDSDVCPLKVPELLSGLPSES